MVAEPSRLSLRISFSPPTCCSWRRTWAVAVFSSSRAEVLGAVMRTVTWGMSTDGSNVTGIALYVTIPMMKKARKAITTAVGLLMRNFTIVSISSRRRRATRGRG